MTYADALDALAARRDVTRLRHLCSEANPDETSRLAYRALAVRDATGDPPAFKPPARPAVTHRSPVAPDGHIPRMGNGPPPARRPPTLRTRLVTAAGAAGRAVVAVATGSPVLADAAEASRRLAICGACEYYAPPTCRKCGCNMPLKARLATEKGQCPEGKW